jgi:plasmid stabilization system protein ParE
MARRYPERSKLVPEDADGARAAWSVIEDLWTATKQRISTLPEGRLHARVEGEWSLLETLRHLVFVTDLWISDKVLARTGHFHRSGLPPTFITDPEPFGIDLSADPRRPRSSPSREDRMEVVCALVADITDEELEQRRGEHTVLLCLWTVFDEEWYHNWFANRDLDALDPW